MYIRGIILCMKAFIFDPLWDELVTKELIGQLEAANIEAVITKDIAPLRDSKALYQGIENRILCINPDYVDWKLAADDYKDIPGLKGIFGEATSTSWIDMSYAEENNIPICNIKNFSTEAVAEWAVTMMMNVARKVPLLVKDGFPLDFGNDYMKYRAIELHGKTAAIIGLGNIGSAIAKRCAGLGMDVVYWNRSPKTGDYKYSELSDIFAKADVIFPTTASTPETNKLITTELLRSMKETAILVGIEHHLYDGDVVLDMVKQGKLYGYGFEAAPKSFDKYEGNVWAAPAYGWATDTTMNNAMTKWIENMVQASKGQFPNMIS